MLHKLVDILQVCVFSSIDSTDLTATKFYVESAFMQVSSILFAGVLMNSFDFICLTVGFRRSTLIKCIRVDAGHF